MSPELRKFNHTNHKARSHFKWLQAKVLCEVVLYRWNDRLNKLEEDDEVLVDSQLTSSFCHLIKQLLHGAGMLARMYRSLRRTWEMRMCLHGDGLVSVVRTEILIHLVHAQGSSAL